MSNHVKLNMAADKNLLVHLFVCLSVCFILVVICDIVEFLASFLGMLALSNTYGTLYVHYPYKKNHIQFMHDHKLFCM